MKFRRPLSYGANEIIDGMDMVLHPLNATDTFCSRYMQISV